jgi:hypothetical protein
VSERFSLLLEAYFKYCGKTMRQQLMEENSVFMDKLYKIALEVKKETHHKLRKTKLQDLLKQTEWPTKWRLPLDPRIECSGFIIEKCRVFGSKTVLKLLFSSLATVQSNSLTKSLDFGRFLYGLPSRTLKLEIRLILFIKLVMIFDKTSSHFKSLI